MDSLARNLEHRPDLRSLDRYIAGPSTTAFGKNGKITHLAISPGRINRPDRPIDPRPTSGGVPDLGYGLGASGEVRWRNGLYLPAGIGTIQQGTYRELQQIASPILHGEKIIRPAGEMRFETRFTTDGFSDHLILPELPNWDGDFLALRFLGKTPKACGGWLPYAIDSQGQQAICDLWKREDGFLLVLDMGWLAEAVFPVDVDPDISGCLTCWCQGSSTVYATARAACSSTQSTCTGDIRLGQILSGSTYIVARYSMIFSTQCVGTITDVTLDLASGNNAELDTDFDVQIAKSDFESDYDGTISHSGNCGLGCTNCEAIYDTCLAATTDVTWRNTSGMSTDTYYTSPSMDTTYAQGNLDDHGRLYYCIRSAEDKNNSAPIDGEAFDLYCCSNSSFPPILHLDGTFDCGGMMQAHVYPN